jgi:hypothetical protein
VFATQRLSISAVTEYLNTLEELKKDSIPPGVLRHSVEGVGTILAGASGNANIDSKNLTISPFNCVR